MDYADVLCLFVATMGLLVSAQPPGVPPQQHNQQQNQQQNQQINQQQNQQQHQQQHQQQGHGGPPASGHHNQEQGQGHGHTNWRAETQNAEHMMEHLNGVMNKSTSEMTEQELQFYYFKLHDYDNNNKLDGLELTKAITHFHGDEDPNVVHQVKPFTDADITGIVDVILKDDDLDNDGFIEYVEFMTAQQRQRSQQDNQQQNQQQNQQPQG